MQFEPNIVQRLKKRESGFGNACHANSFIHDLFNDYKFAYAEHTNGTSCCCWIGHDNFLFGGEATDVCLYNVKTGLQHPVPLHDDCKSCAFVPLKIMKMNFSKSLLCLNWCNKKIIVVCSVPELDKKYLLEGIEGSAIEDCAWIDDAMLVVEFANGHFSLWKMDNAGIECESSILSVHPENVGIMLNKFSCKDFGVLCESGKFKVYDQETYKQVYKQTNVHACLSGIKCNDSVYAFGEEKHITICDVRETSMHRMYCQPLGNHSMQMYDENTVTCGTGVGLIMFYDLRNNDFVKVPHRLPVDHPDYNTINNPEGVVHIDVSLGYDDARSSPLTISCHEFRRDGTLLFGGRIHTNGEDRGVCGFSLL